MMACLIGNEFSFFLFFFFLSVVCRKFVPRLRCRLLSCTWCFCLGFLFAQSRLFDGREDASCIVQDNELQYVASNAGCTLPKDVD